MRLISTMANHPNEPNTDQRAKREPAALAQLPPARAEYLANQYGYTPEQIAVVRNAICVGATDAELEFFLATCKRVNLDPFARQIWFVKRRQKVEDSQGNGDWVDVGRPETGIDGYRTIAERTGEYEGQGVTTWCGPDGKWVDVWLKADPPAAARSTIFRKGFREPLIQVALFSEYCPKYNNGKNPPMWMKMPANQLAKCSEAGGFRRAFPRDLSGLVTDTEMEHVDVAGSGYAAPAIATKPAAQIEERKERTIIDMKPADTREPVTVAATEAPTSKEKATDDEMTDIDRAMVPLLKEITGAQSREALGNVGTILSAAKGKTDAYSVTVIDVLKPALEKRWRELPPPGSRKRGS